MRNGCEGLPLQDLRSKLRRLHRCREDVAGAAFGQDEFRLRRIDFDPAALNCRPRILS
jgi:hypothetical protein